MGTGILVYLRTMWLVLAFLCYRYSTDFFLAAHMKLKRYSSMYGRGIDGSSLKEASGPRADTYGHNFLVEQKLQTFWVLLLKTNQICSKDEWGR